MFKLREKHDIIRDILKCGYIPYSPSELSTINTANHQSYINISRRDAVNCFLYGSIDLNFDEFHADNPDNRYTDNDKIRLVNLAPIALFSNYKLVSSNGKHIEEINNAHIACLMYKLISSAKDSDDLSIGFDRDRDRRQRELTDNIILKEKNQVRNKLRYFLALRSIKKKLLMA